VTAYRERCECLLSFFIELENCYPENPDLNPVDYSLLEALQQMCIVKKFQTLAEMRANQLLDSAKPEHVELSDQSAAKKTDDGYQGEGCPCRICSGLILCANRLSLLLLSLRVRVKNWVKSIRFCQIQHNLTCCKLGKEYLNALTCKYSFSRQN